MYFHALISMLLACEGECKREDIENFLCEREEGKCGRVSARRRTSEGVHMRARERSRRERGEGAMQKVR